MSVFCDRMGSYYNGGGDTEQQQRQTLSAPLKAKKKSSAGLYQAGSEVDDIVTLLHGSDPVRVELTRLENEVRGLFYIRRFLLLWNPFFICFLFRNLNGDMQTVSYKKIGLKWLTVNWRIDIV